MPAPVGAIDSADDAACPLVPNRRTLSLKVRKDGQPGERRGIDGLRLRFERFPRSAGRARVAEPFEGGAAQRSAESEPAIASDVMTVDEARVEAWARHRHEEIPCRAEHQTGFSFVDDAGAQRARREVATPGDDRRSLALPGRRRGRAGDRPDNL